MIDDNGMQKNGQRTFAQWAYKIRVALTAFFFVILPWQTRWIYRTSPIHPDAEWGRLSLYASEILFGVLLIWALVLVILRPTNRPKDPVHTMVTMVPLDSSGRHTSVLRMTIVGVFVVLLYGVVRSWFAADPVIGFQHTWWLLEAVLIIIFLRTGWFPWRAAMAGFFIGLSLAAALGIYQAAGQYAPGNKWLGLAEHRPEWGGSSVVENADGRFLRAYGSLPHPNILGGYMVLGLLLVIMSTPFVILSEDRRMSARAEGSNPIGIRFLDSARLRLAPLGMTVVELGVLTVLFSVTIALSFSRSAWIAWAVGLAVALAIRKRAVLTHVALSVLTMAVVLVALWPITVTRFDRTARLEARAIEERVVSIADGIAAWKQTPWFGVGPAQYMNTFSIQHPNTLWWQLAPPHNAFVALLVEYGVVGAFLVVVTVLLFLRSLKKYSTIVWLLPLVVLSLFDHYLWSFYSGLVFIGLYSGFYTPIIHTLPTVRAQIHS